MEKKKFEIRAYYFTLFFKYECFSLVKKKSPLNNFKEKEELRQYVKLTDELHLKNLL